MLEHLVMGNRLSRHTGAVTNHCHFLSVNGMTSDGRVDRSFLLTEAAEHQRVILTANMMPLELLGKGKMGPLDEFDKPILSAVERYAGVKGISNHSELSFKFLSMIYGAVILVDGGYESADMAAGNLRAVLSNEL